MKKIKTGMRRILALLLALLLNCSLIPVSAQTVRAEGEAGSFVLMAMSGGQPVIRPVTITGAPGASVKEALLASGYSFEGLAEDGWIRSVEGVTDSYALYYDNAGYDLSVPAASITAIWITGNYDQGYSDALLKLEKDLAVYLEAQDGRQNYAPLQAAGEAALAGFWSADAAVAAELDAALLAETENYLAILNSDTVPVRLAISQAGAVVVPAVSIFTDAYGNKSSFMDAETANLAPGSYTYELTDGGINHVSGSIELTAESENILTAELPSAAWVASVSIGTVTGWTEAVERVGEAYLVPDYAGSSLYPCVENAPGVDLNAVRLYFGSEDGMNTARKSWNSKNSSVGKAVVVGSLAPATVKIQALLDRPDGTLQMQEYSLPILRVPTLKKLTVTAEGTVLPLGFDRDVTEYNVSTVAASLEVKADLLCEEAGLSINGDAVESGSGKTIALQAGKTDISVRSFDAAGTGREYILHVEKKAAADVEISHAAGMETLVKNAAGAEIQPASSTGTKDLYHLTPGETYTWIGTKNQYYHTAGSFTAVNGAKITAATPIVTDWLSSLTAKSTTASSAVLYEMEPQFSPAVHEAEVRVGSSKTFFYVKADTSITDCTVKAAYTNYQGNAVEKEIATGKFVNLAALVNQSGKGGSLLLTLSKTPAADGISYYQEYQLSVCRSMELSALTASGEDGNGIVLIRDNGSETAGFDKTVLTYTAGVKRSAREMTVSARLYTALTGKDTEAVITVASEGGSGEITYNEERQPDTLQSVTLPLNPNRNEEIIRVTVSHPDPYALAQTYSIRVKKLEPVATVFRTTPEDAVVFLTDDLSGDRIFPEEDGSFLLSDTLSYSYVITAKGYIAVSGSFTASQADRIRPVVLEAAPESSYADLSAEDDWNSFRQGENNNGITDAATPIASEDAMLVWANKIGDGYGSGATGCPILVGGYLYTYAGNSIVKVDKETGEVVQTGEMAGNSSFAINSPTYAAGMIFVGLSNGRVQAFNAETLESLWLYTDPLGGQANSTITYKNGYVYTGFWNGEVKTANYVCLSVTDEDPAQQTEAKQATWRYTDTGFYWAGAYATDSYVLVTTDDGSSGTTTGHGSVVSLDPSTGRVLDSVKMPCTGDLRSSICYDPTTDACYFTSKGGFFCKIRVNADGSFAENSLQTLPLTNGSQDGSPAMSSSTPTVYKGRAYVGVSGSGQFTPYSGHNITVIDLASWSIVYTVPTQGYPQTSGVLTTAYEKDTEYVYVYFLDNYTPGKIRVLRDRPGQSALDPEYSTRETYVVKNETIEVDTAYVLFTPSGRQAQYAICSPIVDAEGNLYFKNDSAQLMKLSSTITSLEVTAEPETTVYCAGQKFDPSGIRVTAHYANGAAKDISGCLHFYQDADWESDAETEPLKAEVSELFATFDQNKLLKGDTPFWVMYHDEGGEPGREITVPYTTVALDVQSNHIDQDGDKICDRCGQATAKPPVITKQPEEARGGVKSQISFTVACENAVSYQWQYSKDGKKWNISNATGAKEETLSVKITTSNAQNVYRCKITGEDGSIIYSDTVGTDLIPGAKIIGQPDSCAAMLGETVTFNVRSENAVTFQWQYSKNGSTWYNSGAAGAKTDTLTIAVNSTSKGNLYRCKVIGPDGNATISWAVSIVLLTERPKDVQAAIGDTVTYRVVGPENAEYQWQYSKDGEKWYRSSAAGADTDTLSIRLSASSIGNQYRCKLTTADGTSVLTNRVGVVIK